MNHDWLFFNGRILYNRVYKKERTLVKLKVGVNMITKDMIRKLIEISDIKRYYLTDIIDLLKKEVRIIQGDDYLVNSDILHEKFKMEDMVLKLDMEFVDTLDEIKENEGITSLIELDKHTYPNLYDLKMVVEDISGLEGEIEEIQSKLKKLKIDKIGEGKAIKTTATLKVASSVYKKNNI